MPNSKQIFKLTPTVKGIVIFYAIIFVDMGLVLARKHPFQGPFLREIGSHISNFAITSMLIAVMSFIMALQATPFKLTIWLGVIAVVLNFIVELFVPLLNTPDVIDAFYGVAGVAVTGVIMRLFYKVGVNPLV